MKIEEAKKILTEVTLPGLAVRAAVALVLSAFEDEKAESSQWRQKYQASADREININAQLDALRKSMASGESCPTCKSTNFLVARDMKSTRHCRCGSQWLPPRALVSPEAAPKRTDGTPLWALVIEDMRARDQFGREKYGTPLQAHNGRDPLIDAYQEALDLCVYLRQEIEERRSRPA